jgi:hypothetical protein
MTSVALPRARARRKRLKPPPPVPGALLCDAWDVCFLDANASSPCWQRIGADGHAVLPGLRARCA